MITIIKGKNSNKDDNLEKLLKDVHLLAIVCNQWGDTGKGKFVDYFAEVWADVIARGTGANNAGHTIVIGEGSNTKKYIFHLLPSGILHDDEGKINIIGNGVLVNPAVLLHELHTLDSAGKTYNGLRISNAAHLITPDDMLAEYFSERAKSKKIGTTMRGVGPGFSSKIARDNVRMSHLLNKDEFVKKYTAKFNDNISFIEKCLSVSEDEINAVMKSNVFKNNGKFRLDKLNLDDIISEYIGYGLLLKEFFANTSILLAKYRQKNKHILLEGAQGTLLDIDHGTYPYTTSSNCCASGLACGAGIPPNAIDKVYGITKMFYMTRVGGGPFPTEFVDESRVTASFPSSEELRKIGKTHQQWEKEHYNREQTLDEIRKGNKEALSRYCRVVGGEYGVTTGRPRRTGWLDMVALRYAIAINGPHIISTKSDVLDHLEKIKLCVGYDYKGQTDYLYEKGITMGDKKILDNFPTEEWILNSVKPIYITMDGWMCDTSNIKKYTDLPPQKIKLFDKVEKITGAGIDIISVGPEREQTIIR